MESPKYKRNVAVRLRLEKVWPSLGPKNEFENTKADVVTQNQSTETTSPSSLNYCIANIIRCVFR
jgi:hypothetical protein